MHSFGGFCDALVEFLVNSMNKTSSCQQITVVFAIKVTIMKASANKPTMVHKVRRHRQGHCFKSLLLCDDDVLVFGTLASKQWWVKSHEVILIKDCTPYK